MKVLVVGHSYAKDLERLFLTYTNLTLELKNNKQVKFDIHFHAYPGKDYEHFLNNPELFEVIKLEDPDMVIIILGGNSIVETKTNFQIAQNIRLISTHLKSVIRDGCIRLVCK